MSKAKYIYIDDYIDPSIQAIKDGLNDTKEIEVELEQVQEFTKQISSFENDLKKYSGAILDLRLDGNHALNVKYTATSLAQELRARSAANEGIKDIPIVLCSTDEKIKALYDRDQTSHDLFDFAFKKDKKPNWVHIAKTLQSLSTGYNFLRNRTAGSLEFIGRDISTLDSRVFGKFSDSETFYSPHEIAQHIIKELFLQPGPLIDQMLVAARLGIDVEKSPDYEKLLREVFSETSYAGVFCDGWPRWWADLVNDKFKNLTETRLATLKAQERVDLLKKATKLNKLVPATPIENSISTNFWTVCEYFKRPLDPMEGFKIFRRKEQKPWQETRYLSFEAAAERLGYNDGLKIHPDEMQRLETAKKRIKAKE